MSTSSETDALRAEALRAEATSLFLGREGVVGIARSGEQGLTFFVESDEAPERHAVSDWAAAKGVEVRFLVSGRFTGIGLT